MAVTESQYTLLLSDILFVDPSNLRSYESQSRHGWIQFLHMN